MAGHGMRSGLEIGVMLLCRGRLAWSPWGIRELASFPTGVEVFYRREPLPSASCSHGRSITICHAFHKSNRLYFFLAL